MTALPLLSVTDCRVLFPLGKDRTIRAVDGVSFDIRRGEVFGLVGESGCGKSTLARAVMGLLTPAEGRILFRGRPVRDRKADRARRRDVQRNMQFIFQDSAAALNPRMKAADIIAEPLIVHRVHSSRRDLSEHVDSLLRRVGLDPVHGRKYPGELSGGQRQRVAIARALAPDPDLIVADEPVASLDVSLQAQILSLFLELQRTHGFSFLFIAHDLSLIRCLCDRVGVMRAGRLVELAPAEEIFAHPLHPYTRALIAAMPVPDPVYEKSRTLPPCPPPDEPSAVMEEVRPGHFLLRPR